MTLKEGDIIDVRDSEYIWCAGKVLKVNDTRVFVHYIGWHRQYDEEIGINSSRLANFGFYTKRNYIPRYLIKGENNCVSYLYIPTIKGVYKNYALPLLDTADEYYNYENSKVCD
jgi:hypothetical protein